MTLIKMKPTRELLKDSMISSMFDSLFNDSRLDNHAFFTPRADIKETEGDFNVSLTLPGMEKENIKIEMKNDSLVVSGERKFEKDEKNARYHLVESRYGKFSRTFYMPENVKKDGINAEFKNGILNIVIPKAEAASPKVIEVK